jgi:aryl carrier-like protein
VLREVRELTGAPAASLSAETPLMEAGIDSLAATELASRLRALAGVRLSPVLVFEQPTPRAIAVHIVEMTGHSEATECLTAVSVARGTQLGSLTRSSVSADVGVHVDAQLPPSSQQYQLLLHQQLQPDSTAYNEPVSILVDSHLAEPMGRAALQVLVRRHAVLRTLFALDASTAVFYQVVLPEDGFSVPLACCSTANTWAGDLDVQLRTPFDLLATPPLRAMMLHSARSRLVLGVHHVAADLEAMTIMHAELTDHCAALALHHPPQSLRRLELQYADFALWEHTCGQDDASLSWWVLQLEGAPDTIDLPLDRPRPDVQATAANQCMVRLDRDLMGCVVTLCASAGTTLNTTLLAIWSRLLHHLSGQTGVVIGLPHSMR